MSNNGRGALVGRALVGAWLKNPPELTFNLEELNEVAPALLGSGAGALCWWRVRHSGLRTSPVALELEQAYRFHTIRAGLHEREIQEVISLLRSAGVEPILVKGWAIARLYPEKGLRPYGDIDLCFRPDQYPTAAALMGRPDYQKYHVDLHEGFSKLDDFGADELYARSQLVGLGGVEVRVLSPEDHLRILCVHLLGHGAFRPLWLCDIAAALESRPASFDWDRCLGGNRRRADWVLCTLGLAHKLLEVKINDTPAAARANSLPSWLVPHVLKQWEAPYVANQPQVKYYPAMTTYLRHPAGVIKAIRKRWPDPLEATIRLRGPLNELPRLPFQIGYSLSRITKFLTHL
ncbi:MAG TPA: nucleotidyltransferase family protein [Blastocatellia bacterium]|nr:nucleotidyltransferase family protein [Blastocatellia bacterium]